MKAHKPTITLAEVSICPRSEYVCGKTFFNGGNGYYLPWKACHLLNCYRSLWFV